MHLAIMRRLDDIFASVSVQPSGGSRGCSRLASRLGPRTSGTGRGLWCGTFGVVVSGTVVGAPFGVGRARRPPSTHGHASAGCAPGDVSVPPCSGKNMCRLSRVFFEPQKCAGVQGEVELLQLYKLHGDIGA